MRCKESTSLWLKNKKANVANLFAIIMQWLHNDLLMWYLTASVTEILHWRTNIKSVALFYQALGML